MKIHVLPAGPIQTNAYVLTAPERGEALLIDAPQGVWPAVKSILDREGCRLVELWLTHGHFDHIQGVDEVLAATGVRCIAHEADRAMMASPATVEARLGFELGLQPVHPDGWFTDGDTRQILGQNVEVRAVPGHCPGSVLFYLASEAVAFSGDAIFAGSVGRTDFEGGDFSVLEKSIREKIYTLPDDTRLYPGHGPATTVGVEKRGNPFVRA